MTPLEERTERLEKVYMALIEKVRQQEDRIIKVEDKLHVHMNDLEGHMS